jgi:purine-binding chemotaxis protein CheW
MSDLFLLAQIGGRQIAIGSDQVESVVDVTEIIPVPCADARVRGLAALRSTVVTVIDVHTMLGLNVAGEGASRAVVTLIDGHRYAILVDRLEDIVAGELKPIGRVAVLEAAWQAIGCGFIEVEGDPVLAVTLRAVIPGLAEAA